MTKFCYSLVRAVSLLLALATGSLAVANPLSVVHVFGPDDGEQVWGDLTLDGMTLYGAARRGGVSSDSLTHSGAVYKVNVDGSGFQVLHSFEDGVGIRQDGSSPQGGLSVAGGYVYGAAVSGGPQEGGVYFRVATDGSSYSTTSLFSYQSGLSSFGAAPNGDLVYGVGTTKSGGSNSRGVLLTYGPFSLPGGTNGLYSPIGAMVSNGAMSNPALFGVAQYGGDFGYGGIFKISMDGTGYQVLHSFAGGSDGYGPTGTMLQVGSKLYGTAWQTVYSMNLDGTGYQVISNDAGGSNLTLVGDRLYGTSGDKVWEVGLDGNNYQVLFQASNLSTQGGLTFVDLTSSGGGTWLYGAGRFDGLDVVYKVPFQVVTVPEPNTLLLAGLGFALLLGHGYRRSGMSAHHRR